MSVGEVVTLVVLVEAIVLFFAVRWLIRGLRSAECREWPPVRPLASSSTVPTPRETVLAEERAVAVG